MSKKTVATYTAVGALALGVIAGPAASWAFGSGPSSTVSVVPGGSVTDAAVVVDESQIDDPIVDPAVAEDPVPSGILVVDSPVDDDVATTEPADSSATEEEADPPASSTPGKTKDGEGRHRDGDRDRGRHGDDRPSEVAPAAPHRPHQDTARDEDRHHHDGDRDRDRGDRDRDSRQR